jgi:flagellar motor switch protein FliM
MGEILSQDEVNALLKGIADGAVPAGGEGATRGGVRTLDLTNQERDLRGRLPGLELVIERLTRQIRGSLAGFFGELPTVGVRALEAIKFATFLERLTPPLGLQLFRLTPLRGQGMVVVTPPLAAALLQVFFGGDPGRKTAVPERDFSAIELRVLERLGARILQDLRAACEPIERLECAFVRTETNPRFAAVAAPQDLVVLIEMGVEVQGCSNGSIAVVIPNAALDPVRARLAAAAPGEREAPDASWSARLRTALAVAEIEVSAELGSHHMPLGAVLGLKIGDVIPLGTGREGPVLVRVAGRPRFLAAPGLSGGNNAVRVTAPL